MISYRKLAMRVLGHSPVSAVKTARRSTAKRAAALQRWEDVEFRIAELEGNAEGK